MNHTSTENSEESNKHVPILALHGFTGRGKDFEGFLKLCGSKAERDCPDLPGHGPAPSLDCTPEAMVDCIHQQKMEKQRIALGYSMGARAALLHAITHPDYWDALILISGTAGIESDTERSKRQEQDQVLAERLIRDGVEAFLRYWQQTPIIQSQQKIRSDWRETMQANRRQHTAEGLAASLQQFGQGNYPNLWPALDRLHCPVLLISGEQDSKYCTLAKRMSKRLPDARWAVIPEAGHAPHLEAPKPTAALITTFSNALFGNSKIGTD